MLESEDGESCAIATLGARNNETEDGILAMAGLLMDGDYGVLRYESDRRLNEANRKLETGLIMGVYEASHDGTELVATQRHRFEPPTVMLPDER